MGKSIYLLYIFVLLFLVSIISIGYAALNTNLNISGEAVVNTTDDIFVSSISLIESTDVTEIYDPKITYNTTNIGMNLSSASSFFTYEVVIINNSSSDYYLWEIRELINSSDMLYFVTDLYKYDEFEPGSETVFRITYMADGAPANNEFILELEYVFKKGERYNDAVLAGSDPELIDGLIPIIYNESNKTWEKADVINSNWYDYTNGKWANSASVISSMKDYYVDALPGTIISMEHMTSMLVWIPRFSYTIKDTLGYQGLNASLVSLSTPGGIDIKFMSSEEIDMGSAKYSGDTPSNYFTSSAFCWGDTCDNPDTRFDEGNKEISGFWIAKFEASWHDGLLYSKPNETPATNLTISSTFNLVQNLMNGINGYNNYGYIGYVNAHLIKNTEWGAIAYLSQSEYGKYGNPDYVGINKEIYLNNCSLYITGIGGDSPGDGRTEESCYTNTYDTYNGMGASTTGNIYGVYDMVGGTFDRVMGIILDANGNFDSDLAGFSELPEGRYINIYPYGTYTQGDISPIKGDALTETLLFYDDRYLGDPRFSTTNYYDYHWLYRGGSLFFSNTEANGVFSYTLFNGQADLHHSSRFTITMYR